MLSILMKRKIIFYLFIFVISFFNIFIWYKAGNNTPFSGDNLFFGMYLQNEGLFDSLFSSAGLTHGGGYTALFLTKFMGAGLSKFLNLHISDFIGADLGIIRGICFCLMLLFLTKASLLYKKSKLLFILLYLFLSIWTYHFFFVWRGEMLFVNNTSYFRFIFPLIFFFAFFEILSKSIINPKFEKKIPKKKKALLIVLFIFCSVFIATNAETISAQAVLLIFMIFLYAFSVKLLFKNNFCFNLHLGKFFYIPSLFLYIFFFFYIYTPGTQEILDERMGLKLSLKEYFNYFIQGCFITHKPYVILLLVLFSIAFYIAAKRKEIKKIIFPSLLYISLLIAMFLLAFAQKDDVIYVIDQRIKYTYGLVMFYSLFLFVSYILKYSKFKILFFRLTCFAFILLSVLLLIDINKNIAQYIKLMEPYYIEKKQSYIQEKMFRYYNIKSRTPYLDKINIDGNTESALLYIPEIKNKNQKCSDITWWLNNYYLFEYNKEPSQTVCYSYDAIDKFYEQGGYFSENEIKYLKFYNLFNDDFVLNTQGNKLKPDEIKQIMSIPVNK